MSVENTIQQQQKQHQDPAIFASGAEALLAVKLFQLRNAKSSDRILAIVETIFLLVRDTFDDDSFLDAAVSMKTMESLRDATIGPLANASFLLVSFGIMSLLVLKSRLRTSYFIDIGGIDYILEFIQTDASKANMSTVALFACVLECTTEDQRVLFAPRIFEAVVVMMERHGDDDDGALLYRISCHVLGDCFGPSVLLHSDVFHRAAQCIFNGIIIFRDDDAAQSLGRRLLIALVGVEAAMSMISYAEMHHMEGAMCSCAA